MSQEQQRVWIQKELKKAEARFEALKKISQRMALPGGRLKLEDWDRPDLIQLKD